MRIKNYVTILIICTVLKVIPKLKFILYKGTDVFHSQSGSFNVLKSFITYSMYSSIYDLIFVRLFCCFFENRGLFPFYTYNQYCINQYFLIYIDILIYISIFLDQNIYTFPCWHYEMFYDSDNFRTLIFLPNIYKVVLSLYSTNYFFYGGYIVISITKMSNDK